MISPPPSLAPSHVVSTSTENSISPRKSPSSKTCRKVDQLVAFDPQGVGDYPVVERCVVLAVESEPPRCPYARQRAERAERERPGGACPQLRCGDAFGNLARQVGFPAERHALADVVEHHFDGGDSGGNILEPEAGYAVYALKYGFEFIAAGAGHFERHVGAEMVVAVLFSLVNDVTCLRSVHRPCHHARRDIRHERQAVCPERKRVDAEEVIPAGGGM